MNQIYKNLQVYIGLIIVVLIIMITNLRKNNQIDDKLANVMKNPLVTVVLIILCLWLTTIDIYITACLVIYYFTGSLLLSIAIPIVLYFIVKLFQPTKKYFFKCD